MIYSRYKIFTFFLLLRNAKMICTLRFLKNLLSNRFKPHAIPILTTQNVLPNYLMLPWLIIWYLSPFLSVLLPLYQQTSVLCGSTSHENSAVEPGAVITWFTVLMNCGLPDWIIKYCTYFTSWQYLHDTLWFLCFVSHGQITAINKRFICGIGFNFFVLINETEHIYQWLSLPSTP